RAHTDRRDQNDRVARHHQADQDAGLEHHREAGQSGAEDRIDGLHRLDRPEHEVVHPTSVEPRPWSYAVNVPAPRPLSALPLDGVPDAELLFVRLFAQEGAAFWLDVGPEATAGWSILGAGRIETAPDAVRAVALTASDPHTRELP